MRSFYVSRLTVSGDAAVASVVGGKFDVIVNFAEGILKFSNSDDLLDACTLEKLSYGSTGVARDDAIYRAIRNHASHDFERRTGDSIRTAPKAMETSSVESRGDCRNDRHSVLRCELEFGYHRASGGKDRLDLSFKPRAILRS